MRSTPRKRLGSPARFSILSFTGRETREGDGASKVGGDMENHEVSSVDIVDEESRFIFLLFFSTHTALSLLESLRFPVLLFRENWIEYISM